MRRLAAMLLAALLGACASAPPTAPAAVESREAAVAVKASPSSADDLLAYMARLRAMNEATLAAEAARQKRDTSDMGRVKAAIALSVSQGDEGEILALVEPVEKHDAADRDVKAMAGFLHAMALERRGS